MSITYRANSRIKALIDIQRLKFYAKIGGAYLLILLFVDSIMNSESIKVRAANDIWLTTYIIAVNFLFFDYILPRLSRKKTFQSLLLLGIQFLLYSFGLYAWRHTGMLLHIYSPLTSHSALRDEVCTYFPYSILSFFFFGIIKHIYDYIQLKQTAQQLQIEKQEAELNYLKSQTNPHFLFNTLNNIYSLAKDKSDLAPESILRLSDIMRFMLYETGGEYIAIEQEVHVISDYIALEKLRYDQSLQVDFRYTIPEMQQLIPPLLLIPLVENAFKHGASETRNRPFVDIHLSIKKQQLMFIVKNSCDKPPEEWRIKENIGLSNLRRQLELLYTDYDLAVEQDDAVFTAFLTINLQSHV